MELELCELKQHSTRQAERLRQDNQQLKTVVLGDKQAIEQLVHKVKSLSRAMKIKNKQNREKDQQLSELKIDYYEVTQALEEYKNELEKVGNVEQFKKRLENEKKARCQLVKEKVS